MTEAQPLTEGQAEKIANSTIPEPILQEIATKALIDLAVATKEGQLETLPMLKTICKYLE